MNSVCDDLAAGLPHSEIHGSKAARASPRLIATCYVLHRLSVPRHPPDALTSRLSATPNGKNHLRRNRRFRRGDRRSASFAESPGAIPVPPSSLSQVRQSSLPAGPAKPRRLKTLSGSHAQTRRSAHGLPPRSQLAYSHLSINNPPGIPQGTRRRRYLLRAAYRVRGCPRRAFRRKPCFRLSAARNGVARVVEVIGLEPTTSCLQSRRSPN